MQASPIRLQRLNQWQLAPSITFAKADLFIYFFNSIDLLNLILSLQKLQNLCIEVGSENMANTVHAKCYSRATLQ